MKTPPKTKGPRDQWRDLESLGDGGTNRLTIFKAKELVAFHMAQAERKRAKMTAQRQAPGVPISWIRERSRSFKGGNIPRRGLKENRHGREKGPQWDKMDKM